MRTDRGTRMTARLCGAVAAVCPPGVGRWEEAWTLTAPTDRAFMAALRKWEQDENPGTVAALKAAFDAHVNAWKKVVELWRKQSDS